jgi:DmsE family decaheme c-type cytochrome
MSMRRYVIAGSGLLLLLALSGVAAGQETPPPPPPPTTTTTTEPPPAPAPQAAPATEQAAAEEVPPCSTCHEDQVKAFLHNPHARGSVVKGEVPPATCATCHEGAEEHAKEADPSKVSKPVGFKGSENTCMLCHDTVTDRISRRAGMHSNTEQVNCLSCHSIHHGNPGSHLVARPQLALCGSCHTQAASTFNKPYAHRLDRGGMACSSCHEPHGRPAKSTRSLAMVNHLRATQSGEVPCTNCHAEKRGPFVFQHGAFSVGECTNCHETHGSTNAKMLRRAEVWQLCIECHSPTGSGTLGSQPPSFHNLNSPRYRNCTSCHVAIHGSNRDPQLFK